MKGGVSSYSFSVKRGWRGLVFAVLGLVILSMLVPLVFLLGLHNGFHSSSGFGSEDRTSSSTPNAFKSYDPVDQNNHSQTVESEHLDNLIKILEPSLTKDVAEHIAKGAANDIVNQDPMLVTVESEKGRPALSDAVPQPNHDTKKYDGDSTAKAFESMKVVTGDELRKSCQLEFGSYCLWLKEHKEEMKDATVKKMKDKLFVARAYFPTIAKLPTQDKLSRDMKQNIQEFERILSESTTDVDLPPHMQKRLEKMEAVIAKAKTFPVDCNNVDKKLRQILDLTEDEAHFHMKQSAFLYQLAVQTIPKSHHCLSMRLTVEYFRSHSSLDTELLPLKKFINPELHHYVLISNNILASSVVINSTVMHSKESGNLVFHVLTDRQNYFAMKLWFFRHSYKEATIHLLNVEDLNLQIFGIENPPYLTFAEEFRVSLHSSTDKPLRTEYISVFGHTHYLLSEIFQNLTKVIVLDEDIVVQQDLTPLWSLGMEGKVLGAVQFCAVKLGQLKSYLGEESFDNNSCTWMSGLNIVDLVKWRERNLTEIYRRLQLKGSTRVGALPATLLTFHDMVYALDGSWALSGLGHDYGIGTQAIKKAAVLHYNGKMKPWLELGISKYKVYWKKFLTRGDQFMAECNVNS